MPKLPKPVDERMAQLLYDASVETKTLGCEDLGAAVSFRQRLYENRQAMQRVNHPFYEQAAKITISVTGKRDGEKDVKFSTHNRLGVDPKKYAWYLIISDQGTKHDELLEKAGYTAPQAPDLGD